MNKLSTYILPMLLTPMMAQATDTIDLTDLTKGDPFYYTSDQIIQDKDGQKDLLGIGRPNKTHSQIPHLPFYSGYMSTNYTYRFITVAEQVMTMIGEGKHGLWRVQENGTVRLYLKKNGQGLSPKADLNAAKNLSIIESQYSAYLPEESWSGYKYPDQVLNESGQLNFIDLPINHARFKGKYAKHVPIELPNYYCTMSGNDYPYAQTALNFAFQQKGANQIGPLGIRAGLDVNENYTKVIRLNAFPDGRSWVNIGQTGKDKLHVKWEAVDTTKTDVEYYLVERPFFNKPYLFVTAVYDNKDNADHRYVRPEGAYYDSIKAEHVNLKTNVTTQPRFHLENGQEGRPIGLPIYGVHHPNRAAFNGGGACPLKGGDWGRYPKTTGGSGWPTQYEEVTPLCDAVLVDIKFYSNLDGRDWNNPNKYLANAGYGTQTETYTMEPGKYGVFSDPYLKRNNIKNAEALDVPHHLKLFYPAVEPVVEFVEPSTVNLAHQMVPAKGTSCRPVIAN